MRALMIFPLLLTCVLGFSQEENRQELLNNPKYDEKSLTPTFQEMTAGDLEDSLKVISSRSYAWYGFNNPGVQLHLPDFDNSIFAETEMAKPSLSDNDGFELENGGFDVETRVEEIRFLASDGEKGAEFSRVTGEISLRYPLTFETRTVTQRPADQLVTIDGPFVEYLEGSVTEAPYYSPMKSVRAYDSEGRRLEKASSSWSRQEAGRKYQRLAFHGLIAKVEVDRVLQWVEVSITYDLPPAPLWPKEQAGFVPEDDNHKKPTPGGKVKIEMGTPYTAKKITISTPSPKPEPPPQPASPKPASEVVEPPTAQGPPIPIPLRSELSPTALKIAQALDELIKVVPQPLSIVQVTASKVGMVAIKVDVGSDRVEEYIYSFGRLRKPRVVNTQFMNCKTGMALDSVILEILPALWDDAPNHVNSKAGNTIDLLIAQNPCGTPFVNLSVKDAGSVHYTADGRFLKTD